MGENGPEVVGAVNGTLAAHATSLADKCGSEVALERRITKGVSGSFVISVVTLPFGYLTSLVLARVSPEAVGIYSVLGIYLGIVSSIFYFGGGTVTIRFLPELPKEQKSSFFISYLLFTLAVTALLITTFTTVPGILKFFFGSATDTRLWLLLFLFSPLPLFFFSAIAALKGLMEVTLAQSLMRATTVGACLVYGYFLLAHGSVFRQAPGQVIFISYFLLLLIISAVAFYKLRTQIPLEVKGWSWFLPAGFWSFTLGVQGASMLGLLHMKIDQILVLRKLDLSQLGIFFVILQISESCSLLSMFFVEGVLPGITNLMAARRLDRIRELYKTAGRHLVLLATGLTCFLLAFGRPVLRLFGDHYTTAFTALLLLTVVHGLDSLTWLNATLMSGLGKPNYWTATQIVRIGVFIALFGFLTDRYGLVGVALARAVAWILAEIFSFYVVLKRLGIKLQIPSQFPLSIVIILSLGAFQHWVLAKDLASSVLLFLVGIAVLFRFGGYQLGDLTLGMALLPAKLPLRGGKNL